MLLTATLCLLAFGAVMVFSASSTTRVLSDGGLSDSAFYLKRTLMFGAVGLLVMHLRRPPRAAAGPPPDAGAPRRLASSCCSPCWSIGTSVNGASRWIGSGFLQIQPSELAKVALILYGADLLARKPKRARLDRGDACPSCSSSASPALLIVLEPDLGTTMVIAFAVGATLVAAGARLRDLALIALVLGVLVAADDRRSSPTGWRA